VKIAADISPEILLFLQKIPFMDELKAYIAEEIKNLAFKKVSYDESLLKSKLLDSITIIELIVFIEEKTGKKIPQHLITEDNFDSVDVIINTLAQI